MKGVFILPWLWNKNNLYLLNKFYSFQDKIVYYKYTILLIFSQISEG